MTKVQIFQFCYKVTDAHSCVNRYRSITKQFFRKADGVVVMYDVTVQESFKAVRPWLINVQVWDQTLCTHISSVLTLLFISWACVIITVKCFAAFSWFSKEAAGEGIPILLLGNKMDMTGDREVSFKEAELLAFVSHWIMFFTFRPMMYYTHYYKWLVRYLPYLFCVGKQGDVFWSQCLHRKVCGRVPDTPGQVTTMCEKCVVIQPLRNWWLLTDLYRLM